MITFPRSDKPASDDRWHRCGSSPLFTFSTGERTESLLSPVYLYTAVGWFGGYTIGYSYVEAVVIEFSMGRDAIFGVSDGTAIRGIPQAAITNGLLRTENRRRRLAGAVFVKMYEDVVNSEEDESPRVALEAVVEAALLASSHLAWSKVPRFIIAGQMGDFTAHRVMLSSILANTATSLEAEAYFAAHRTTTMGGDRINDATNFNMIAARPPVG